MNMNFKHGILQRERREREKKRREKKENGKREKRGDIDGEIDTSQNTHAPVEPIAISRFSRLLVVVLREGEVSLLGGSAMVVAPQHLQGGRVRARQVGCSQKKLHCFRFVARQSSLAVFVQGAWEGGFSTK